MTPDEWRARLLSDIEQKRLRDERRRAIRRALQTARSASLRARHASKTGLTHTEVPPMPTKPCGCTTDHLCPQHLDALTPAQRRQWLREHPATGRRQHTTQDPDRTPRP